MPCAPRSARDPEPTFSGWSRSRGGAARPEGATTLWLEQGEPARAGVHDQESGVIERVRQNTSGPDPFGPRPACRLLSVSD
jgi:hypothetical protein